MEEHLDARITGAPALHDGRLFVPVASLEEVTAAVASYQCCTFRGSIVALDASTGEQLWKTYPIADEARRTSTTSTGVQRWGPSGAGIWASPTLDPERNVMYVATGDSYSQPADPSSDALMALAMDTGRVRWVTQTFPGDAWPVACISEDPAVRANCPEDAGPDVDYGSAMILTTRTDGQRVLLAGQKSGVMYSLDAATGEILWETRVADGGMLGGIEWGFATDGDAVFVSTSDAFEEAPGEAGGLTSLQVANGEVVWHAPPVQDTCGARVGCHTAQPGAVTAIPGVVFSGSLDGPHPRLRDRHWSCHLGRRYGRRVRHGERRAGPGRRAQRPRRDHRGWDTLRQLRLQHPGLHGGQRAARVLGRRPMTCLCAATAEDQYAG